jgi:hypothetical protein
VRFRAPLQAASVNRNDRHAKVAFKKWLSAVVTPAGRHTIRDKYGRVRTAPLATLDTFNVPSASAIPYNAAAAHHDEDDP